MQIYDVIIIGASFSGLVCAEALAERGLSVLILEKKASSFATMHTTGILPMEALEEYDFPKELLHPIRKVALYHRLGSHTKQLHLQDKNYTFYGTKTNQLIHYSHSK